MEGRKLIVDREVLGNDSHGAAIGHRVTRIHGKVEQNLLHLTSIRPDRLEVTCAPCDQGHVLPDGPSQQRLDLTDDVVHVEDLEISHLSPGEGEQLMSQAGGSLRCSANLRDIAEHGSQPYTRLDRTTLQL